MKALIDALLKDENGISENAYFALLAYLEQFVRILEIPEKQDAFDAMHKIVKEVPGLRKYVIGADATDGRFYFGD